MKVIMSSNAKRPSPTASATLFKVGTKKRGNNGKTWVIVKNTNGVKRWKQVTVSKAKAKAKAKATPSLKGKSFLIHDNGGRPFLVNVSKNIVGIYKQSDPTDENHGVKSTYTKLIKTYKAQKVFIGKSPKNKTTTFSAGYGPKFNGNTILIKLLSPQNKYVFIGERIYSFTAPEPIIKYYSAVGNNDVPYPVALSKNFVYFMLGPSMHYKEKKKNGGEYIPRTAFPKNIDWSDAYTQYYELFPEMWYAKRKGKTHQMKGVKLVHKRIW